jgi:hypothetical protein
MSLILTAACPLFTMQVSDRLISTEDQRPDRVTKQPVTRRPYDTLSNKAIVFRACNAIVSMGYVGSAYLERMPTDEWLAERLWGDSFRVRTPDGRVPKCMRAVGSSRDIGLAVRTLQAALESAAPNRHGLTLTIVGWQAAKKHARPVLIKLERRGNEKAVSRFHSPRWWEMNRTLCLDEIGGYLTADDLQALGESLRDAGKSKDILGTFERILAETVRRVSATNPGVGSDLMSVILPSPTRGLPCVRFLPSSDHQIEVQSAGELHVLSASYSPWLIGPAILHPPSIIVGSQTVNLGGVEVTIHGDEPTGHIRALSSSQRRPAPP